MFCANHLCTVVIVTRPSFNLGTHLKAVVGLVITYTRIYKQHPDRSEERLVLM